MIRSSGFGSEKIYVVQTQPEVVQRCVLMTTDPGATRRDRAGAAPLETTDEGTQKC